MGINTHGETNCQNVEKASYFTEKSPMMEHDYDNLQLRIILIHFYPPVRRGITRCPTPAVIRCVQKVIAEFFENQIQAEYDSLQF